jgi:hypothetical protein
MSDDEIESLQQMLEPEGTGVHESAPGGSRGVVIALVIAILLASAIGVGLFVFKDQIFGGNDTTQQIDP